MFTVAFPKCFCPMRARLVVKFGFVFLTPSFLNLSLTELRQRPDLLSHPHRRTDMFVLPWPGSGRIQILDHEAC